MTRILINGAFATNFLLPLSYGQTLTNTFKFIIEQLPIGRTYRDKKSGKLFNIQRRAKSVFQEWADKIGSLMYFATASTALTSKHVSYTD